jgi:hypothetical protein
MKVRLSIAKSGVLLHEAERDVSDARSFGEAFASVWSEMRQRRLGRTANVGAFMDAISESELDELDGTAFTVRKM